MRLRSHLVMLVLAAVLPLLVFAGVIVYRDIGEQRRVRDEGILNTARALSLAVDGEVKAAFAVLQTLAASPLLTAGDFAPFHVLSQAAIAGRHDAWIVLFDRSGQQIINTRRSFGARLPNPFLEKEAHAVDEDYPQWPLGGAAPVRKAFETGQAVVSDLFIALDARQPTVAVGMPVVRDGAVRYVLEMSVEPEALSRILVNQRLPDHAVASLLDGNGMIIARTLNPERRRGGPLGPELARQVGSAREGTSVGRTPEGLLVYLVFTRSDYTGWRVSLGLSEAVADAAMRQTFALLAGGAIIAVLLGAAAAIAIGRRISTPLSDLAGAADEMARGERGGLDVSAVRELAELQQALVSAGDSVRRAAEERQRSVVDHVVDGIITIDERGTVVSFNPSAESIFGYTASEIMGQNVKGLMPEPYRAEHDGYVANYLETGQAKVIGNGREVVGQRKDGSTLPMDLAVSEFRVGRQRFFTGIVRDITQRKRMEQALRDADRAKDEFLALLSHELRTPLAALTASSHVLGIAAPQSEHAAKARAVIDRQTKHMSRLVADLLDVNRIALGKLVLQPAAMDLADAVRTAVDMQHASGRLDAHDVVLQLRPAWTRADRTRIEQVVTNLLDNALKFSPAGKRIALDVRREGAQAVLRVTDEGIGLSPEECERVFDLFVQVESAQEARTGLGIGLALVKRIAELHGGSVSASSAGRGRGCVFTVWLPAIEAPEREAEAAHALRDATRSILIVEDSDDARQMLATMLQLGGHEVRTAPDGRTGLALAVEAAPDVAFIDVGLPDMDGYALARRLRAALIERGANGTTLVALTGFGREEDRRRALEAGFDAHLVKPVSLVQLEELIAGLGLTACKPDPV